MQFLMRISSQLNQTTLKQNMLHLILTNLMFTRQFADKLAYSKTSKADPALAAQG